MISHRDEVIVSDFAEAMAAEFRLKTNISRGKVNDYLEMDFYVHM